MSNFGFDKAVDVLRYLGHTIEDGKGNMYRSIRRAASEMASNPPGGIMAGSTCATKMREVSLKICDEVFPPGTRVSYHRPHDWSEMFRGVCTEHTSTVNNEHCRVVQPDDDGDTRVCCVDLLELVEEPTDAVDALEGGLEEEECPNCQCGTVGIENGRLVCRGECGTDFGPSNAPRAVHVKLTDKPPGKSQAPPTLND